MQDVKETAEKIRTMEIRGALEIAVAASKALERAVIDGATYGELVEAGDVLRDARPTAISLPNAINYILYLAESHRDDDPVVAKPMLLADIADYISTLESSMEKIAETGSRLVEDGDVILTICNSETVVSVLKLAWSKGRRFRVYACETRPRLQGHITVKELAAAGVDVTMIVDSAAYHTMLNKGVTKVLVGADTVYANGDVVNKIGTSQVALAAKQVGAQVIVCTETIKYSPYSLSGGKVEIEEREPKEVADIPKVKVYNPAFDVTAAGNIDRIVTEDGVTTPRGAKKLIRKKFVWMLHGKDE